MGSVIPGGPVDTKLYPDIDFPIPTELYHLLGQKRVWQVWTRNPKWTPDNEETKYSGILTDKATHPTLTKAHKEKGKVTALNSRLANQALLKKKYGVKLGFCDVDGYVEGYDDKLLKEMWCQTWAGLSPSGNGAHVLFWIPEGYTLDKEVIEAPPGYDWHDGSQMLTFGVQHNDEPIRMMPLEYLKPDEVTVKRATSKPYKGIEAGKPIKPISWFNFLHPNIADLEKYHEFTALFQKVRNGIYSYKLSPSGSFGGLVAYRAEGNSRGGQQVANAFSESLKNIRQSWDAAELLSFCKYDDNDQAARTKKFVAWYANLPNQVQDEEGKLFSINEYNKQQEAPQPAADAQLLSPGSEYSDLPWPTGHVGKISEWVHNGLMHKPHKEIAVVAGWTSAAALVGRKDSFGGMPPRIRLTLLGITTVGKSWPRRTVNTFHELLVPTLMSLTYGDVSFEPMDTAFGLGAYTLEAISKVSGVVVDSEAGIKKKSSAGDVASLKATLMDNQAQYAYEKLTSKTAKEGKRPIYGTNLSFLDESTKEAYEEHMQGTEATGEAGRNLLINACITKRGKANPKASPIVPAEIANLVTALGKEAVRGEGKEVKYPKEAKGKQAQIEAIASVPVPNDLRRNFTADARAAARIAEMEDSIDELSAANKANKADIAWAMASRRVEQVKKLALIWQRTENIGNGSEETIITLEAIQNAEAFVTACNNTTLGNATSFEPALETIVAELVKRFAKAYAKPTASFKRNNKLWKEGKVNQYWFFAKATKAHNLCVKEAERGGYRGGALEVLTAAVRNGQAVGLWNMEGGMDKDGHRVGPWSHLVLSEKMRGTV